MGYQIKFNTAPSRIMHIDLNSCFASIEQQANPMLRDKPIAVAAYTGPGGCILAPSVEAKEHGIKTGMRVYEGKMLYPKLIVLTPDPPKYRDVHLKLRSIFEDYTSNFHPKSIDEFVLNLKGFPVLEVKTMFEVGKEIKARIKAEAGDWLRVSMGIAPNRFLAKTGSNLNKPDGLDEVNADNIEETLSGLELIDLYGINKRNKIRLNSVGIFTPLELYKAPLWRTKAAFKSINAYYWHVRLRGWEVDDMEFGRKTYGNSYALPRPFSTPQELSPILTKLIEKMSSRLRRAGYKARGIHLSMAYRDGSFWHKGVSVDAALFDAKDFFKRIFNLLINCPHRKSVRVLAVSCFNLTKSNSIQFELFDSVLKKESLVQSIDDINERWGAFTVASARMLPAKNNIPDRIAFGSPR